MIYEQSQHNKIGSALCKAIGLDPKLVKSIRVTINCAVDDIATLDIAATSFADEKVLAFLQDESNIEALKTIDKDVELKND